MSLPHFLSADTLLQSPAFIKQHSLTKISVNSLASSPEETLQTSNRTFINDSEKGV